MTTQHLTAALPLARAEVARVVRVALAGCGVVGSEFARQAGSLREEMEVRYGIRFEIVSVLVRHEERRRDVPVERPRFTTDPDRFLSAQADVVVEALGGIEPALRIARAALSSGKRLVTANKTLVAAHGVDLTRLARQGRGRFDFESAVGGGIPVVRAVRDQLNLAGIRRISGILNGTTNFVFSRLEEGFSFGDALGTARAQGYAEADPSRDLQGQDSEDKIRILAWLAFGVDPAHLPVQRRGILPDPDRLAADARALAGHPRLLAECVRTGDAVEASVHPVVVQPGSALAGVCGADNFVEIDTLRNGIVRLAGPGAGGGPTASAIIGDLIRGARPVRPVASAAQGAPARRECVWVLSVAGAGDAASRLSRTLERAGLTSAHAPVAVPGERRVVEGSWRRVDLAVRALEADGLRPMLSRVER